MGRSSSVVRGPGSGVRRAGGPGAAAVWLVLVAAACGGDGASGPALAPIPTGPVATAQDDLAQKDLEALLAGDADLAALRDRVAADGFGAFVSAGGVTADDGARLDFGEWADGTGAVRAVVRHCRADDCVRAVAEPAGETMRWTDADGTEVPVRAVPLPPLLRQLDKGKAETKWVAPLTASGPVDPATVDTARRRLVVASQFGEATGLAGAAVAPGLAADPRFTEVVQDDHATSDAIEGVLKTSHPGDVVVVVGQGVRQLYRTLKDGTQQYQTVGLATSTGLYGLSTWEAWRLSAALHAAPLAGPGVLLLLGGNSLGDASDATLGAKTGVPWLADLPGTVVAGFSRTASPQVLLWAGNDFLARLGTGATVEEARAAVNVMLEAWGLDVRLELGREADGAFRLPPAGDGCWKGRVPASMEMNLYLRLDADCVGEEQQRNPWFQSLAVEGPVFSGSRDFEGTNMEPLHAEVRGYLPELRKGAWFHFLYRGDVGTGYVGVTLYAHAQILAIREEADGTHVEFDGSAESPAKYVNEKGQTCTLRNTLLGPRVAKTAVSELLLKY